MVDLPDHIAVRTRDGKELLIPNEDLITQRVTNCGAGENRLSEMISLTKPHLYFLAKPDNRPAQQDERQRKQQGGAVCIL